MQFACRSFRPSTSIRECQFLFVTSRAGLPAVHRHALFIKQAPTQFDLCRSHRVIGRHDWPRKPLRQIPVEGFLDEERRSDEEEENSKRTTHEQLLDETLGCHPLLPQLRDLKFR